MSVQFSLPYVLHLQGSSMTPPCVHVPSGAWPRMSGYHSINLLDFCHPPHRAYRVIVQVLYKIILRTSYLVTIFHLNLRTRSVLYTPKPLYFLDCMTLNTHSSFKNIRNLKYGETSLKRTPSEPIEGVRYGEVL